MRTTTSETQCTVRKHAFRVQSLTKWLCLILISVFFVLHSMAQYSIEWYTIDSGGGTSTGGLYTVSGTLGQSDAGEEALSGSGFSLTGGFWAIYAIQTPGAPFLNIVVSGPDEVTISWAPYDHEWILQEAPFLESASWTNSPSHSTNPVVISVTQPMTFYRLKKP